MDSLVLNQFLQTKNLIYFLLIEYWASCSKNWGRSFHFHLIPLELKRLYVHFSLRKGNCWLHWVPLTYSIFFQKRTTQSRGRPKHSLWKAGHSRSCLRKERPNSLIRAPNLQRILIESWIQACIYLCAALIARLFKHVENLLSFELCENSTNFLSCAISSNLLAQFPYSSALFVASFCFYRYFSLMYILTLKRFFNSRL